LKAAIGNALGNKSLFGSNYQAYKKVKYREMQCSAEIVKKMVKKSKTGNHSEALFAAAKSYANPVLMYLNIKICFLVWLRYSRIYDECDKDSVDIDSDDFKLSEHEISPTDAQKFAKFKAEMDAIKTKDRRMSIAQTLVKRRAFAADTNEAPQQRKAQKYPTIGGLLKRIASGEGTSENKKEKSIDSNSGGSKKKLNLKMNSVLPIIKDEEIEEELDDSKQILGDFSRFGAE
jgi:hypothetical protein